MIVALSSGDISTWFLRTSAPSPGWRAMASSQCSMPSHDWPALASRTKNPTVPASLSARVAGCSRLARSASTMMSLEPVCMRQYCSASRGNHLERV